MASFFDRLFGRKDETSADLARERLKLVLVTDRSDITPDQLRRMQGEIIDVIKRYLNVTEGEVHIKLEQRERRNYLVANIPLIRNTPATLTPDYVPAGMEQAVTPAPEAQPEDAVEVEPPPEPPQAAQAPAAEEASPPAEEDKPPAKPPAKRRRSSTSSRRSTAASEKPSEG